MYHLFSFHDFWKLEEEAKEVFNSTISFAFYLFTWFFIFFKIKLSVFSVLQQEGETEYKFEWQKVAPREK